MPTAIGRALAAPTGSKPSASMFLELIRRGYSDEDVLKIAGRNHLRAMRRMEQVAAELQRTQAPLISERAKAS